MYLNDVFTVPISLAAPAGHGVPAGLDARDCRWSAVR
jgi:hypothetical protein